MADSRHIENRFRLNLKNLIVWLTRNLVERSTITAQQTRISNYENSRWRMDAILKLVLSLYLSRESSDFIEIWWCTDALLCLKDSHVYVGHIQDNVPNFCKFKMADGHHIENRFSVLSHRFIVWLTWNFVRSNRITRHRSRDKNILAVDIWSVVIKHTHTQQI